MVRNCIILTFKIFAFNKITEESKNIDNIMLVTHGSVINVIYHIVRKQMWANQEKGFNIANASIHRIQIEENRISINEIKI